MAVQIFGREWTTISKPIRSAAGSRRGEGVVGDRNECSRATFAIAEINILSNGLLGVSIHTIRVFSLIAD
jgi:hypothetical protein